MSHPRELGPNAASCPSNVGVAFIPNESQCNTEQALGHTGGVPSTRFSQPFHQVPPGCEQALLCASPHRIVSDCTPDCNPPHTSQPAPCSCFQGGYKADEQPFIPFDCDRQPDLSSSDRPPPYSDLKLQQCTERDQDAESSVVVQSECLLKLKTKANPTVSRMNEVTNFIPEEDEEDTEVQHLHIETKHSPQLLRELPNSKEIKSSLDPCKQKAGVHFVPTSISLNGTGTLVCHDGIAFTSKAESTQTTTKCPSNATITTESQDHTNGKSELVIGQITTLSNLSEDSHEYVNVSAPITFPVVGSVTPVLHEGDGSTQLTSLQYEPCIDNLQGNAKITTQQPAPIADSAGSAICSNLKLNPEFNLQSLDKLIIHLILCTKPSQFGVAVKYLPQLVALAPDPFLEQILITCKGGNPLHTDEKALVAEISGQYIAVCQHVGELGSIASPSTLDQKQQSSLVKLLSNKDRLHPPAKLSLFAATGNSLSYQQMLPPSNPSSMLTMHTLPHRISSHNPWVLQRIAVWQSCNSHTFECHFVPETPLRDQITLSITIHPRNAATLPIVGVAATYPTSEQFLYHSNAILPYADRYNFTLEIPPQLLLLMGKIEHNNVTSFPSLSSHLQLSATSARVANLKAPVAHSPSPSIIGSNMVSFTRDVVPILNKESLQHTLQKYCSKEYLHVNEKSTVLPVHKNQCRPLKPVLMRSCFEKSPPLDLKIEAKVVSSPHSHEENGSYKDGSGQEQESSGSGSSSSGGDGGGGGNDSNPPSDSGGSDGGGGNGSTPPSDSGGSDGGGGNGSTPPSDSGGSNGGGGNGSTPPSDSGSGGNNDDNDDNKRGRKQDGKKGNSNQKQEKKKDTEGEDDTPSGCKEDDWRFKQHTSRQQHDDNQEPPISGNTKQDKSSIADMQPTVHAQNSRLEECVQGTLTSTSHPCHNDKTNLPYTDLQSLSLPNCQHNLCSKQSMVNDDSEIVESECMPTNEDGDKRTPRCKLDEGFGNHDLAMALSSVHSLTEKEELCGDSRVVRVSAPVEFQSQESPKVHSLILRDSGTPESQQKCSSSDVDTVFNQQIPAMLQNVSRQADETEHPKATSSPLSSDVSLSQDLQTPAQKTKHTNKQFPVPNRKGQDKRSELVGLQEENQVLGDTPSGMMTAEALPQDQITGHIESPVVPSNYDKPVGDLQALMLKEKRNTTKQSFMVNVQSEHPVVIRPQAGNQVVGDIGTGTTAIESSPSPSQNHDITEHQDDHSPDRPHISPNSEECADGSLPEEKHTTHHLPVLEDGTHDGCSQEIRPSMVTHTYQQDLNVNEKHLPHSQTKLSVAENQVLGDISTELVVAQPHSQSHDVEQQCGNQTLVLSPQSDRPVDDPKTSVLKEGRHITASTILEEESQDGHSKMIKYMRDRTTGAVAMVHLQPSSTCHGLREYQDDQGPSIPHMPPSNVESVDDFGPQERRHISEYSTVPQESKQSTDASYCPVTSRDVRGSRKQMVFQGQEGTRVYSLSLQDSRMQETQQQYCSSGEDAMFNQDVPTMSLNISGQFDESKYPKTTFTPPSSHVSLLQTSAQKKQHTNDQSSLPDGKGHDRQSEVDGLQEENQVLGDSPSGILAAEALPQDQITGHNEDDEKIRPLVKNQVMGETTTETTAIESPHPPSQNYDITDHQDDPNQDSHHISPNSEERAEDPLLKEKHSTHYLPVLEEGTQDGYSEKIKPPMVMQVHQQDLNIDDKPLRHCHTKSSVTGNQVLRDISTDVVVAQPHSQNHNMDQHHDNGLSLQSNRPVDDLQRSVPKEKTHITASPILKEEEHSITIRPITEDQLVGEPTTRAAAVELLQPPSMSHGLNEHQSPCIPHTPPSNVESVDDFIPKENRRISEYPPVPQDRKQSTKVSDYPINPRVVRVSALVAFQRQESAKNQSLSLLDSGILEPQQQYSSSDEDTVVNQQLHAILQNVGEQSDESKHPKATSPPPSSDVSLSHDLQIPAQKKKHITEQPPVPDRKGNDRQSELVVLQEGNQVLGCTPSEVLAAEALPQDQIIGHIKDDQSPVTLSNYDNPVDDLQTLMLKDERNAIKQSPTVTTQREHPKVIIPQAGNQVMGETTTGTIAIESSPPPSQNHDITEHQYDHSPGSPHISPNSEECADGSLLKEKHTIHHLPVLEDGTHDGCSEEIKPSMVTHMYQQDLNVDEKQLHCQTKSSVAANQVVGDISTEVVVAQPYSQSHDAKQNQDSQMFVLSLKSKIPVDHPQTSVLNERTSITTSAILKEKRQDGHCKVIRNITEDQVMGELTTKAIAMEPLQPPSMGYGLREHHNDQSPGFPHMPPSNIESVDDFVPKENRHTSDYSPTPQDCKQSPKVSSCQISSVLVQVPKKENTPVIFPGQVTVQSLSLLDSGVLKPQQQFSSSDEDTAFNQQLPAMLQIIGGHLEESKHPKATSPPPSSDVSLSHALQTPAQKKQHITEPSPVLDRKCQDKQFELQEGNHVLEDLAEVVSTSQHHSTGQHQDDNPSPVTTSNGDKPVDDLQTIRSREKWNTTETFLMQQMQEECFEVQIRPIEEATEPLHSSQSCGIKQRKDDYSPSSEVSAIDSVPKKKHTIKHPLMLKGNREDGDFEGIGPFSVTKLCQHDSNEDSKPSPHYATKLNGTATGSEALEDISSEAVAEEPHHSHSVAQHQDHYNLATVLNQPVHDLKTSVPKKGEHATECFPTSAEQSQEPIAEYKVIRKTTTVAVAIEPIQSPSTAHGYRKQEEDHSPDISYLPPSSEESADDPVPKKKSPVLQEGSQDTHSEAISLPPAVQLHGYQCDSNTDDKPHLRTKDITSGAPVGSPSQSHGIGKHQDTTIPGIFYGNGNRKSHVMDQSLALTESKTVCCEAQRVETPKVSQSHDKGETLTDVVMNSNVVPTTCPMPHQTTAQDMRKVLPAFERIFPCDYENVAEEDTVDVAQDAMSEFQDYLQGSILPVQLEDTAHSIHPGATALVLPQMTATAAVFVSACPAYFQNDNELFTKRCPH